MTTENFFTLLIAFVTAIPAFGAFSVQLVNVLKHFIPQMDGFSDRVSTGLNVVFAIGSVLLVAFGKSDLAPNMNDAFLNLTTLLGAILALAAGSTKFSALWYSQTKNLPIVGKRFQV